MSLMAVAGSSGSGTHLIAGIAVARASHCGGELRVGSRAVAGIAPRPIVPPVHSPRAHLRPGVSCKSAEMIEAEPIEIEVPLGRQGPGMLRIHQIANVRVAQVQGARFRMFPFQTAGLP